MASAGFEFSVDEVGEAVAAKLCACIGDFASTATGIKVEAEELGNDVKFKGLTEVAVNPLQYCQRPEHAFSRWELLESLRCNRIKPTTCLR